MGQMNSNGGLKVLVARRGKKFMWELRRDGMTQPVKFSVPIFLSEAAANASGTMALVAHLARLAKRHPETAAALPALQRMPRANTGARGTGS